MNGNQELLNEVSLETIKEELGDAGWKKIEELTTFLFSQTLPPKRNDLTWRNAIPSRGRFAPSLVSRGEVQVYGASMPRFCFRIYFRGADAFVNVRRLKTFHKQVCADSEAWWGERAKNLTKEEKHPRICGQLPNDDACKIVSEGMAGFIIADCLLQPPRRYPVQDYHLITKSLHREYGEVGSTRGENFQADSRQGTPFVKPVAFGGGLCAQACCFIATAILHDHARGVYGLGEITALASSPQLKELLIAGLNESEIVTYFHNVGLNAVPQFSNPNVIGRHLKPSQDLDFKQALHGYVASHMPVILGVDPARLNGTDIIGESIYASNSYRLRAEPGHARHAVTVVGCSRWENFGSGRCKSLGESDYNFLFLDPSAMPFMKATVQQLAQVGDWQGTEVPGDMRHPILISVTPERVKMPLLWWGQPDEKGCRFGLIRISRNHAEPKMDLNNREFILATLDWLPLFRARRHFGKNYQDGIADILHEILPKEAEKRLRWNKDHWVWLECGAEVVKVWDAEAEAAGDTDPYDPIRYLRAVIEIRDQQASVRIFDKDGKIVFSSSHDALSSFSPGSSSGASALGSAPENCGTGADSKIGGRGQLEAALISSFTILGGKRASSLWPQTARTTQSGWVVQLLRRLFRRSSVWPLPVPATHLVQFYACMQSDLDDFFPGALDGQKAWDAVSVMAGQLDKKDAPATFAQNLCETFAGRQIVAFATFIPEIAGYHKHVYERGQKALMFLIETARYLQSSDRPFTIELVAGNRLSRIWRADTTDGEEAFAVNRLDPANVIPTLLERLKPVAACANREPRVQLALEMEPGPLFTLGDNNSLIKLCSLLNDKKTDPNIRQVVGVNLNIGHCFLTEIDPEWLEKSENQVVRQRIIHAHICDHGKGHFCDNVIGNFHSLEEFGRWTDFLADLSMKTRPSECPHYSGFISCEMEACENASFVRACIKKLQELPAIQSNSSLR